MNPFDTGKHGLQLGVPLRFLPLWHPVGMLRTPGYSVVQEFWNPRRMFQAQFPQFLETTSWCCIRPSGEAPLIRVAHQDVHLTCGSGGVTCRSPVLKSAWLGARQSSWGTWWITIHACQFKQNSYITHMGVFEDREPPRMPCYHHFPHHTAFLWGIPVLRHVQIITWLVVSPFCPNSYPSQITMF